MKITYFGSLKEDYPSIDQDIVKALKQLGNEVVEIDDTNYEMEKVAEVANKSDLFLFRTCGVVTANMPDFYMSLVKAQMLLQRVSVKKAFWFLDKVIGLGNEWMEQIFPLVDYGFMNDETYVRRHKEDNLYPLHLGVGNGELPEGVKDPKYKADVTFIGSIYGPRDLFMESMKQEFGKNFEMHPESWGKDFADMCQSFKVIVAPKFPTDDFFWPERIYKVLANGGFLVHSKSQGLITEGFVSGVHYVSYSVWDELVEIVNHYIDPQNEEARKMIAEQGQRFVLDNFRYTERVKELLDKVR